jgi:uncharacterized protein (TIGR00369 family)
MNSTVTSSARLTVAEVTQLIEQHFPQLSTNGKLMEILEVNASGSRVRLINNIANIRPGGTVSGPAMFTLADVAVYVAILGRLGESALQAVTTNISLNFLSRPEPADMIAECRLLKVGRRLIVSETELYTEGRAEMVAHVTATYALPPGTAN